MDDLNLLDRDRGLTPPSILLASNLSTGEICPTGRIEAHRGEGGERLLRRCSSSPSPLWGGIKGGGSVRRLVAGAALTLLLATPALAIDPPYQRQMERLSEIMGSLYYLQPLCQAGTEDWRAQAGELIELDEPDDDRRQRLAGAFNTGYTAFSRFHRQCTPASQEALKRLLTEAQRLARDIHTRFAE